MASKNLPSSKANLPKHIAIVMDGNGRWARKRKLTRFDGHKAGVDAALDIVKYCGKLGIPYLTLYAFSSENWNRPREEVLSLMKLLYGYLTKEADSLVKNGVRLHTIGAKDKLPTMVQRALKSVCDRTKTQNKLNLTIALSYGSRDEITRAVKSICKDYQKKKFTSSKITEDLISGYLDTKKIPDPDFLVRTSGENRLSNFLLWQLSYAELYFTKAFWPDFDRKELDKALASFQKRERRYGKTSSQLRKVNKDSQ